MNRIQSMEVKTHETRSVVVGCGLGSMSLPHLPRMRSIAPMAYIPGFQKGDICYVCATMSYFVETCTQIQEEL